MLLVFEDLHKEHLSFLADLEPEIIKEFARISVNFIAKGSNPKVFQGAAQKLGVSTEVVKNGVEGLMYLLTESSKLMLNDIDFQDSLLTLSLNEATCKTLLEIYQSHRREIRDILGEISMDLPHYHNLHWRLDVQLASRSLRHQVTPRVLMQLQTKDGDEHKDTLLETDPVNLVHMTRCLEEALNEMKSGYCRRIVRNIK